MKLSQMAGAILLGSLVTTNLSADTAVQVKYRQDVYQAIGGHMGAIVGILREGIRQEDLALHARGLAALANVTPALFPEGSLNEKSDALPKIWEDRADFDQKVSDFVKAADGFAAAAGSGDMSQVGPAIQALGGSCKGCHDNYKKD